MAGPTQLTHATRSVTTAADSGPSESPFDSNQQILPAEPSGTSSAVRKPTIERITRTKTSLQQYATTLMQPPKKVGPAPTVWQSIRAIITASCKSSADEACPSSHMLTLLFRFERPFALYPNICMPCSFSTFTLALMFARSVGT